MDLKIERECNEGTVIVADADDAPQDFSERPLEESELRKSEIPNPTLRGVFYFTSVNHSNPLDKASTPSVSAPGIAYLTDD